MPIYPHVPDACRHLPHPPYPCSSCSPDTPRHVVWSVGGSFLFCNDDLRSFGFCSMFWGDLIWLMRCVRATLLAYIYIYGSGMFYTIPPLITRAGIVLIADNLRPSSYHTLNFRTSGVVSSLLHNPRLHLHCRFLSFISSLSNFPRYSSSILSLAPTRQVGSCCVVFFCFLLRIPV